MNDEKDKVARKFDINKNITNFKLLKKAKAKVKRELERAARKKASQAPPEDSDSEKVEDLLKKVKEVKRRKQGEGKNP